MSVIDASVSSVGSFAKETSIQYSQILHLAQDVLTAMEKMTAFVEGEKEKLKKQAMQLLQLDETLKLKTRILLEQISEARDDCDYCSDQYQRADDYSDESYWRDRLYSAQRQHARLVESYQDAQQIQKNIDQRKQQFEQLLRALNSMIDALQKNAFEVKKIISLMAEEMQYNAKALSDTLSKLEGYCAAVKLGVPVSTGVSDSSYYSSGSGTGNATTQRKRKVYKLNRNALGYNPDGTRPTYRLYITGAQPVKGIIYDLMKGLHTDFRDAVMRQLEGVIFLSAKHGFLYSKGQGGSKIRIIGVDISDPSFNHLLLLHVGHQLYEQEKSQEKLRMESSLHHELAKNVEIADQRIRQMANDFRAVGSSHGNGGKHGLNFDSSGSRFFSECFKAYVARDYDFLKVVKENFGESYNAFSEIISTLPNR